MQIFALTIACPHGTYKKYPGMAQKYCTKCPDNSGHKKLGSITIRDCKCNKGYEGTPDSGTGCTSKCLIILSFFMHENHFYL